MILVAIMAELMEEYTALLTSVLEHLFNEAPFPRRGVSPLPPTSLLKLKFLRDLFCSVNCWSVYQRFFIYYVPLPLLILVVLLCKLFEHSTVSD
ncbi:hypothetical protein Peur_060605 [Populus x canadensis]